jgi:hypothetical protein
MCVACIEYIKGTLTGNEFKSALRETTREDNAHADAVSKILEDASAQPDEIKKRLQGLEQE